MRGSGPAQTHDLPVARGLTLGLFERQETPGRHTAGLRWIKPVVEGFDLLALEFQERPQASDPGLKIKGIL